MSTADRRRIDAAEPDDAIVDANALKMTTAWRGGCKPNQKITVSSFSFFEVMHEYTHSSDGGRRRLCAVFPFDRRLAGSLGHV
jgi:hypothetical protein